MRNIALTNPVSNIMHKDPVVAGLNDSPRELQTMMRARGIKHIPIVDLEYRIVDLYMYDRFEERKRDNLVVLMAGGLGTRLRPLTDHAPKPLLRVGDKPILETILKEFIEHNFVNFYL